MSWQCGRYYARTVKRAGRVITEYIGGGAAGESAAAEDAQRQADRAAERDRRTLVAAWSMALDEFCAAVEQVARSALHAAGYHRHDRGRWRKRRVPKTQDPIKDEGPANP